MNLFSQDEDLQQDGLTDNPYISGQAESKFLQEKEALKSDESQFNSIYRTRWVAWSFIAVGWGCSLAAVMLRGGAVEWFLAVVLSIIIAISGLAPIIAAGGISAVRVLSRQDTREGGCIGVQLTLKRSYLIPLVWLAVRDETVNDSSASNHRISFRKVLLPVLSKEATVQYTLHKLRRGRHPFGPVSITVGDWLGLTAVHRKIESRSEFVVLPGMPSAELSESMRQKGAVAANSLGLPLAGAALDYRGEAGREEITAAVRAAGLGPDNRPYREGDSLRHLDWRSAAKGRGLYTKLHSLEQPLKTFIAVDTMATAYDGDDRLFDACVGWASLAVQQAAVFGSAVTLLWGQTETAQSQNQGKSENGLGINEQGENVSELLHRMALLRAEGTGSLAGGLAKGHYVLTRGGTILVFTADWRGGRSWGELAGFAAEQGCRMELFIVTRSSVPSFAMREQQKWLERGDVKVTWLHVPASMNALPYTEEGGSMDEQAWQ